MPEATYELEYGWDAAKIKGAVYVEEIGNSEHRELFVNGPAGQKHIATYIRDLKDGIGEPGKTYLHLRTSVQKNTGKGNLLAGVLLWLALQKADNDKAHKNAVRDFIRDY